MQRTPKSTGGRRIGSQLPVFREGDFERVIEPKAPGYPVLGSRVRHRRPAVTLVSGRFRRQFPVTAGVCASAPGILTDWVMPLGARMSAPDTTLVPVRG